MGFRFSKRITIMLGVRLNISGSDISASIGPHGFNVPMGSSSHLRQCRAAGDGPDGGRFEHRAQRDCMAERNPVAYEFTQDVTGVALGIDLSDRADIPRRTAESRGNGKLSFKNRSDA
jgi:hypothetical protein